MAVVKHLIPKRVRSNMVASIDQRFPDGPIRNNIGNAITVGGAILVAAGAKVDGKLGWGLRAVGQIADDVEGDATRALNTSSKFGAKLDAIMDKIKMALELGLLWKHTSELEGFEKAKRRAALGFIGLKHLTNAGLNIAATI